MARIDKVISAGRTYAVLSLTLALTAAVLAVGEAKHWLSLLHARQVLADWIVFDLVEDDFEEWWSKQETENRSVADPFQLSQDLQDGQERYYSGLGAVFVKKVDSGFSVTVKQPSRTRATSEYLSQVPDPRAVIPGLIHWSRLSAASKLLKNTLAPLPDSEAAILLATIGLNKEFKKNHPRKTARLPEWMRDEWSADKRWLTLRSEKDRLELQFSEILKVNGIQKEGDPQPPSRYRELERSIIASQIRVPIIDIEMQASVALWFLAVLISLDSILLAIALEEIDKEALPQREELWLLLDARQGAAAALAVAWQFFLVLSPIVVPLLGIAYILLRLRAGDGRVVSSVVECSGFVLLAVLSAWFSYRTSNRLRALRSASISEHRSGSRSLRRKHPKTNHG
jgi:hypothetical protein